MPEKKNKFICKNVGYENKNFLFNFFQDFSNLHICTCQGLWGGENSTSFSDIGSLAPRKKDGPAIFSN